MNEVSGGKQDIPNTSNWETLSGQSVSSLPVMHHHHQTLQQDANSTMAQVIVPTPVKLQTPILTPTQTVADHCPQIGHIQQPPLITQVYWKIFYCFLFNNFKLSDYKNIIIGCTTRKLSRTRVICRTSTTRLEKILEQKRESAIFLE